MLWILPPRRVVWRVAPRGQRRARPSQQWRSPSHPIRIQWLFQIFMLPLPSCPYSLCNSCWVAGTREFSFVPLLLASPRPSRKRYSRLCRALSPQPCAPGRLCSPPCIVIVSLPPRTLSLSFPTLRLSRGLFTLFIPCHGPPRLSELFRCDCALIHAPLRFSASLSDVWSPTIHGNHHMDQSSSTNPYTLTDIGGGTVEK